MISFSKDTDQVVVAQEKVVLPRVNLLPQEIAAGRQLRHVQAGLAGVVVAAVFAAGLVYLGAAGGVSTANDELDAAGSRQTTLQRQVAGYREVTATYKRVADAQAMLVAAMGQEVRYSQLLNVLSRSVPSGVWVTNITFSQPTSGTAATAATTAAGGTAATGTVTFTGVAFQYADVAAWLESIQGQDVFAGPFFQNASEQLIGTTKTVAWSSTADLSPKALSGRYVKAGG